MKKNAFLIFIVLFWAISCPFIAFKLMSGSFFPKKEQSTPITHFEDKYSGNEIDQ